MLLIILLPSLALSARCYLGCKSEKGVGATSVDVSGCHISECNNWDDECRTIFFLEDKGMTDFIDLVGCYSRRLHPKNADALGCEARYDLLNADWKDQKGLACVCSEDLCNGWKWFEGFPPDSGVQPMFSKSIL